jgi:hypothetical protein
MFFADTAFSLTSSRVYVSNDAVNFLNQSICVQFDDPFPLPAGQNYMTFSCIQLLAGRYIRVMKYVANQQFTLCELMATGNLYQGMYTKKCFSLTNNLRTQFYEMIQLALP